MEEQLKALLSSIYAPQPKLATAHHPLSDADLFLSDDFRMFCYKIVPCSIRGPHEWTTCGFCHPGEKAARRCLQKYQYTAIACPDMKKTGECPRAENCMFAHNVFEYWLHPARYRTQMCSYGLDCKRSICFFAHHFGELRTNEYQAQLQALEREIEGGDMGFGFQNGSRWASTPTKSASAQTQQRQAQGTEAGKFGKMRQTPQAQQGSPRNSFSSSAAPHPSLLQAALKTLQQSGSPSATVQPSLFDAALPPATPPLISPLPSLSSHDVDQQMAAAMRLLADLSVTKQQLQQQELQQQLQQQANPFGNIALSGWQAAAAAAASATPIAPPAPMAPPPQPVIPSAGSAPSALISQLQDITHKLGSVNSTGLPGAAGSAELHSALLGLLPELVKHLGGAAPAVNAPAPAAAPPSAPCSPAILSKAAAAVAAERQLSPVDVLSVRSGKSSSSSGSRSPTLSHRSDAEPGSGDLGPTMTSLSGGLSGLGSMGLGLGMGVGLGLLGGAPAGPACGDMHHADGGLFKGLGLRHGSTGGVSAGGSLGGDADMLLHSSRLMESLSQLVDEPTTAQMMPSIQELDSQLRRLSMQSTFAPAAPAEAAVSAASEADSASLDASAPALPSAEAVAGVVA